MNEYKYDLEIIVPVTNYFKERLNFFLLYGIQNHENYKIKINFLIGKEPLEEWKKIINLNSFGDNVEIKLVNSKFNHTTAKVHDFYTEYNSFDSKWVMRIDDDSITKIEKIMNFLKNLNHENPYYFIGTIEPNPGAREVPLEILKRFNKLELLNNEISHGVEIQLLSTKAFKEIIKTYKEEIIEMAKYTEQIKKGFCDQLLEYLAKIYGIFPCSLLMFTRHSHFKRFVNNEVAHIHNICPKKNLMLFNMINNIFKGKKLNNSFLFGNIQDPDNTLIIKLLNNNIVIHPTNRFYCFWSLFNKELTFYKEGGEIITSFKNFDEDQTINKNNELFLSKIDLKLI